MRAKLLFIPVIFLICLLAYYLKPERPVEVTLDAMQAPVVSPAPATPPETTSESKQAQPAAKSKPKPVVLTATAKRSISLASQAKGLDPKILELALIAHQEAKSRGLIQKPYLTVIDYSKRSVDKRLWIYDLADNKLLYELHVTHGEGSGKDKPTKFSNRKDSHQTSLGVYTTGETYHGMYGLSLKLDGREPGFNDNARKRAIIMHGADFASEDYIKKHGILGTSWACPAITDEISDEVIELIKEGSLIFAYYPEKRWLGSSSFLNMD